MVWVCECKSGRKKWMRHQSRSISNARGLGVRMTKEDCGCTQLAAIRSWAQRGATAAAEQCSFSLFGSEASFFEAAERQLCKQFQGIQASQDRRPAPNIQSHARIGVALDCTGLNRRRTGRGARLKVVSNGGDRVHCGEGTPILLH